MLCNFHMKLHITPNMQFHMIYIFNNISEIVLIHCMEYNT